MMKTRTLIFTLLFFGLALPLLAQNPLVGTWQIRNDTTMSIKIITPTHWMVFTEALKGDSSKFVRSHGGTYTLDDNKYIEHIDIASWDDYGKEKTDFTYKVSGGKFYQKGTVILGDGTVIPIEEAWQKVVTAKAYPNNPGLGTWNQLSSTYTNQDGKKESHTKATATRFEIITPTHMMRISHRNKKFESAFGGPYTLTGNKMMPQAAFSYPAFDKKNKVAFTQKVMGDKRYVHGTIIDAEGKLVLTWDDIFQKVAAKPQMVKPAAKK
jgi:hypothetical protein